LSLCISDRLGGFLCTVGSQPTLMTDSANPPTNACRVWERSLSTLVVKNIAVSVADVSLPFFPKLFRCRMSDPGGWGNMASPRRWHNPNKVRFALTTTTSEDLLPVLPLLPPSQTTKTKSRTKDQPEVKLITPNSFLSSHLFTTLR
jgi:hypothetical protein